MDKIYINRSLIFQKQLELYMVILIIGILAALAIDAYRLPLNMAKTTLATEGPYAARLDSIYYYAHHGEWPKDNEQAAAFGWDQSYLVENDEPKETVIENGAIHFYFNEDFPGKVLTLRPAVPADDHFGPLIWVCGNYRPADKWHIYGRDRTNIKEEYIHTHLK